MRCYCARTRQVARRLTRFYEAELREAGMKPAQFELMANLRGRPGSSQSELAAVLDVDQTTLSRNLKVLIEQGWVSVTAAKEDGRRGEYRLSAEGRKALQLAEPCWRRAMAKMEERLGAEAEGVWLMLDALSAGADGSSV